MKKCKRLAALLMAAVLLITISACGGGNSSAENTTQPTEAPVSTPEATPTEAPADPTEAPTPEPTEAPEETPSAEPEETETPSEGGTVKLAVLSGPTGVGAAKMLSVPEENVGTYEYVIEADNNAVVAGLTNGDLDIATMASNVAVNLYNKTDGGVRILALGTLGVLHILESNGGTSINSIADLAGRTIWSAGQGANPEYILRYLLEQNGLEVGTDVEVLFGEASEIQAKLLTGEIECAMLPVPAATAAIIKGEGQVRDAVDVTEAWNDLGTGSKLVMTAVVARTEFLEEHPDLADAFLKDYEASINYVNENVDEASQMVADLGITPSAPIAKQAIPQCHLTFIAGADMQPAIADYFRALWQLDPNSIGGFVPDDGIYYVP